MPYASAAQRRFLHARHPAIAKRWDAEHATPTRLPHHRSTPRRRVALLTRMKKGRT